MEKLFKVGVDFDTFLKLSSEEEKELISNIISNLELNNEIVEGFKSREGKLNLLLSAETWCPYVRVTLSTLYKLSQIVNNVELRMITEGRGFKFLSSPLGIEEDEYVIPTIAILDENYELLNSYIGKPEKYNLIDFSKIKEDFYAGKYCNDILEEILNKWK